MAKTKPTKKNSKISLSDADLNSAIESIKYIDSVNAENHKNAITKSLLGGTIPEQPIGLSYVNPAPAPIPTPNPLPSVQGGNAVPTGTLPQSAQPYQYSSNASAYHDTKDMNRAERELAMAQQVEEDNKANLYNSAVRGVMGRVADQAPDQRRQPMYDMYGYATTPEYTPMAPLPTIPRKIDIPNMVTGSFGESFKESSGTRGGSGTPPKIDTNIPLFFRDPNGQVRIGWDAYDSAKAEKLSGDPLQIRWSDISDLRSMRKDWTAKQFKDEGKGLDSIWTIKSLKGSKDGKPVNTGAKGNFFDIARASALSELASSRPDAVITKDGKRLNETSSTQFRLNQNKLFGTATVTNEDGSTSKVQYLADKNAYPIIMDGISKALSDNGWKNGEVPTKTFWANLPPGIQAAYKDVGGTARGGTSRDQFVRAIYSYIISENQ